MTDKLMNENTFIEPGYIYPDGLSMVFTYDEIKYWLGRNTALVRIPKFLVNLLAKLDLVIYEYVNIRPEDRRVEVRKMSNVSPEFVADGTYVISDDEYGTRFCTISFSKRVTKRVSHEELMVIMKDFIGQLLTKMDGDDNQD